MRSRNCAPKNAVRSCCDTVHFPAGYDDQAYIFTKSMPAGIIIKLCRNSIVPWNYVKIKIQFLWFRFLLASNACVPTNTKNHPNRTAERVYFSTCWGSRPNPRRTKNRSGQHCFEPWLRDWNRQVRKLIRENIRETKNPPFGFGTKPIRKAVKSKRNPWIRKNPGWI